MLYFFPSPCLYCWNTHAAPFSYSFKRALIYIKAWMVYRIWCPRRAILVCKSIYKALINSIIAIKVSIGLEALYISKWCTENRSAKLMPKKFYR